ncbi:MAG: 4Fe-4S binding protein [Bacteroidetes bacterium]|nr:4Fe-4S binding protein [Bacteroidota bacterium]
MKNPIKTKEEQCVGCHQCVHICPVNANIESSTYMSGIIVTTTIKINENRCIQCGSCIKVCTHNARYYEDDTENFFNDIKANDNKIALITAPSFLYNFENYKQVIGWFRSMGIEIIKDVSFGADITTYLYLKSFDALKYTFISQPCPVIVNYIEKYAPHLLSYLSQKQSPIMCTAIWMRKYENFKGKIAFISPCIAKRIEIFDVNNGNLINYNVTIKKLKEYIKEKNINLSDFPESNFDNLSPNLGYNYSRPGGLKEQVDYYTGGDMWVKQVEGIPKATDYIQKYADRIKSMKPTPQLVDILSCDCGCNFGPGTEQNICEDDIDYKIKSRKKHFLDVTFDKPMDNPLFKMFDDKLNPDDFVRKYTAKPVLPPDKNTAEYKEKVENVYISLGKETDAQRNHNCNACGRGSCVLFAESVAEGFAMINSCFFYSQKILHDILG